MVNGRFVAVEQAFQREPVVATPPAAETSSYYGCNVFNRETMRKYLSSETRKVVYESIEKGATLDMSVAEHVAAGMKRWAMDKGATHYTHWFQPLTGGTAEKHDSFAEPHKYGTSLEHFSGDRLCQQEPDASSFPNGGLRNTFEARGYTAWDPSSPSFILGDCLCIPTVFISYTGDALDYKTPLMRSVSAVRKAASDVLKYFGFEGQDVQAYLGWEQEFFLVDSALYAQRPDMMLSDRTLLGHDSARNQQLEDHYLGSIPPRVMEFMKDLEFEGYKLGIPIKTRHNEVAPNQFEIAPVYEEMNLAVDHNLLLMSLMRSVAGRHKFKVLFHEKPFKGINGSGKHCNWSLGITDGAGLLSPGKTDEENLRFLMFMANVLKALHDNNGLFKASIASSSNEYRLGANEAPPAIISSFLGKQMTAVFDELLNTKDMVKIKGKKGRSTGIPQVPELLVDNTDRNRTSPFAFTGNRFEFRAVGASANCALPMTVLNTTVAYQLAQFKKAVDNRIAAGEPVMKAILDETRETYRSCKDICFDGNGYSDEWKKEAKRRGLNVENSVPIVYDQFTTKETVRIYKETGVLSEAELKARNEVAWEHYANKIEIESRVLSDIAYNHIVPVATVYQNVLLDNVLKCKQLYTEEEFEKYSYQEVGQIKEIAMHINELRIMGDSMDKMCDKFSKLEGRDRAVAYHDRVVPNIEKIRKYLDDLEMIVDDQMWPLPKYRELLFIR
ncbi:glutamine synthetase [Candidatus Methanoplasma termitum]|uniref:GlnA protein n=1 Tax=Candidatus Methanoplasma termitum TaxID=1577791 RepID=A0A0A7LA83_9ARCH|nr:glutamine synthetase III [Candidatus Methanoplasma termitum]AIZ55933.1 glutamine synthetase [Candidatus Methanoplasma termitum]MCL2334251.1 glutamine synthetase III [Candidatus Methanoplasma sp.]